VNGAKPRQGHHSLFELVTTRALILYRCRPFINHLLTYLLSYRKQIARQLRIQYVESIYSNPVTLKSGLDHSRSLEMASFDRSHMSSY